MDFEDGQPSTYLRSETRQLKMQSQYSEDAKSNACEIEAVLETINFDRPALLVKAGVAAYFSPIPFRYRTSVIDGIREIHPYESGSCQCSCLSALLAACLISRIGVELMVIVFFDSDSENASGQRRGLHLKRLICQCITDDRLHVKKCAFEQQHRMPFSIISPKRTFTVTAESIHTRRFLQCERPPECTIGSTRKGIPDHDM